MVTTGTMATRKIVKDKSRQGSPLTPSINRFPDQAGPGNARWVIV